MARLGVNAAHRTDDFRGEEDVVCSEFSCGVASYLMPIQRNGKSHLACK